MLSQCVKERAEGFGSFDQGILVKQQACLRRACWSRAGSRLTGTCPRAAALLLQPRGRGASLGCGSACRPPLASTWAITVPSRRSEPVVATSERIGNS